MEIRAVWLLAGLAVASGVDAYDVTTHSSISDDAVRRSVLNDPASGIVEALCGAHGAGVDNRRCLLPSSSPYTNTLTPLRLVSEGAVREDDSERALNHFFDPQDEGKPLNYPFGFELGESSPDWALEDRFESDGQAASLSDARALLRDALTGASAAEREKALGATFEALGHVVHHLQDMAQPQHVRNDVHCDRFLSAWFNPLPVPSLCFVTGAFRPSAYETYTRTRGMDLPLSGYRTADFGEFSVPRQFWAGEGKGIAEFTSSSFVSQGTNFTIQNNSVAPSLKYPNPGAQTMIEHRQITDADLLGPQGPNQPLTGELWFIATPVTDRYDAGRSAINKRASTYSLFSSDLQKLDQQPRVTGFFSLNRFNYAAANEFLLPRAAAYSTGLINYFFRGRIEIGLPGEGVYGVIDHATTYAAGQGFGKVKLKLRNASPDGVKPSGERVPQTMQGGTLVAVAKYTLNSCYQPDLSGDYAARFDTGEIVPPSCSLQQYLAGDEQISQSAAILAASLDTATPTEFTFDFSSQPIPVNARDLRVQVVYTGTLGAEQDAIAFGGRDISEPTHIVVYNNTDYFAVDGKLYTPEQIRSTPALAQRVAGINIDPKPMTSVALSAVSGKPIVGPSDAVAVNGYIRVAVLAEKDQPLTVNVLSRLEGAGFSESSFTGVPTAVIDLRNPDGYITAFGIFRGPRGHFFDAVFKANSTAPVSGEELTLMSARMVGDPGPTQIPVRY